MHRYAFTAKGTIQSPTTGWAERGTIVSAGKGVMEVHSAGEV